MWASALLSVVLVAGLLGFYFKLRGIWESISHVTVTDLGHRPPKFGSALNILVFGSDSRSGLTPHEQYVWHTGRNLGENNTDTIMLVHISPGRHRVSVIDIPRDTMVPAYACSAGHEGTAKWPGQHQDLTTRERINSVFAAGGPGCLWKTVEQQTHVHIDHFIEIGLAGIVNVIDDLGGVNVCVPFHVKDPVSGLSLRKGEHHIQGVTFLEFWRTREDLGLGSDLQRIQRDQFLMAQVVKAVLDKGLLNSPTRLLGLIGDVARNLTTDSGMTQADMLHIAESFRGIHQKNIEFVTAPNVPYPPDSAEVEFAQPRASKLFHAIAHNSKLPKQKRGHHATHSGTPVETVKKVSPAQVKVEVLNGSGVTGVAGKTATTLQAKGFTVLGEGDATNSSGALDFTYTNSVIEYASAADLPEANTLKATIGAAKLELNTSVTPGTVVLILGSSFHGIGAAPSAKPSTSPSVGSLAKNYGGITAAAACKSDSRAFAGPNSPGG